MVEIARGNLLDAPAEALVNSVNTIGVMGKGIALQFKRAFPENFRAYEAACKRGEVTIGSVFVYRTNRLQPKWILNVPTKRHWRQPSRLDDVRRGIADLVRQVAVLEIRSVAIPPLGCGAGGLAWDVVRPMIEKAFATLDDVRVLAYPPGDTPPSGAMLNRTSRPSMTAGRAAILALASAYLDTGLDDSITTLELQKLAYFMQVAGERLSLRYVKHYYGPYADNLRPVLEIMEGHFITGLGDAGSSPAASFELLPGALGYAASFLDESPRGTRARIQQVLEVIRGFEDAYGLELLATTHWVMRHNPAAAADPCTAVNDVMTWSPRKSAEMKPEHVRAAWTRIRESGWTGVT